MRVHPACQVAAASVGAVVVTSHPLVVLDHCYFLINRSFHRAGTKPQLKFQLVAFHGQ